MGSTDPILTAIVVIGCLTFLSIICAPMAISIYRKICKSTSIQDNFSQFPFPYLASIMNCMMGVIYRLPYVHPDNTLLINNCVDTLLIIYCVGILFAAFYIFLAFKSSTGRDERVAIVVVLVIALVFFVAFLVGISFVVDTPEKRSVIVGPVCDVSGILLYVSTIPALRRARRNKKVENMSLFLTGAGLANSIIWLIYAIRKTQIFMMIQNGIGFIACCIQLTIYLKIIAAEDAFDIERPMYVAGYNRERGGEGRQGEAEIEDLGNGSEGIGGEEERGGEPDGDQAQSEEEGNEVEAGDDQVANGEGMGEEDQAAAEANGELLLIPEPIVADPNEHNEGEENGGGNDELGEAAGPRRSARLKVRGPPTTYSPKKTRQKKGQLELGATSRLQDKLEAQEALLKVLQDEELKVNKLTGNQIDQLEGFCGMGIEGNQAQDDGIGEADKEKTNEESVMGAFEFDSGDELSDEEEAGPSGGAA